MGLWYSLLQATNTGLAKNFVLCFPMERPKQSFVANQYKATRKYTLFF